MPLPPRLARASPCRQRAPTGAPPHGATHTARTHTPGPHQPNGVHACTGTHTLPAATEAHPCARTRPRHGPCERSPIRGPLAPRKRWSTPHLPRCQGRPSHPLCYLPRARGSELAGTGTGGRPGRTEEMVCGHTWRWSTTCLLPRAGAGQAGQRGAGSGACWGGASRRVGVQGGQRAGAWRGVWGGEERPVGWGSGGGRGAWKGGPPRGRAGEAGRAGHPLPTSY